MDQQVNMPVIKSGDQSDILGTQMVKEEHQFLQALL